MKDMVVLLLCGGLSTRLWPLEDKHFINFLDKPLVSFSLEQLRRNGYRKLIIVVSRKNKKLFMSLKKNYSKLDISLVVQKENEGGMAHAVVSAWHLIKGKKLLVLSPSDVVDDSLFVEFSKIAKGNPEAVLAGVYVDEYFPGGYLVANNGKVSGILEKPKPETVKSKIVTLVFHYFKNPSEFKDKLDKALERKIRDDAYERALQNLIEEGISPRLLLYKGYWGYIKYPWHVLNLTSHFLKNVKNTRKKNVKIASSAKIIGDVAIEENAQILENTKIIGPTYIGRGVVVGNNSLIRESMISANSVVGYGSEIVRSLIGHSCWFHSNYIGDSVISNNVSFGSGAVTANYRLDEEIISSLVSDRSISTGKSKLGVILGKNIRVGVNCSIMPGVKVGRDSFLGAGVVLTKDLPEGKFCTLKPKSYVVKDNISSAENVKRSKRKNKLKL